MPKAITISHSPSPSPSTPSSSSSSTKKTYYPLNLISVPHPSPSSSSASASGLLSIRITAAALNHRDLFIRQGLYPGISFQTPLLADGCGVVIGGGEGQGDGGESSSSSSSHPPTGSSPRRVILNPGVGWAADPTGPERQTYGVLGGTSHVPLGTLQEVVVVGSGEVEPAPPHLSDAEAAALPLAGLTAWRALVTKSGNVHRGRNLLVTGIGGGVAVMILQLAVAHGCAVYVTSSSGAKIARALELGAKAGVNYRDQDWDRQLRDMLPRERPYLDAVLDGAGGDIVTRTWRILKQGGVVVSYGMTLGPRIEFPMQAVMKNIEVRGTMMGSRREFGEMVAFVRDKGIRPVVARTVRGIENIEGIEGLFEDMKAGTQFGKLVVLLGEEEGTGASGSAGGGDGSKL